MIRILYNIFITIFFLLGGVPLLVYSYLFKHGIRERFGFLRRIPGEVIWIHTASVGEVRIASIIIPQLKEHFSECKILLTVLTKTGKIQAHEILGKSAYIALMPLDHPVFLTIALRRIKPKMLILTEAELWYNLISMVHKRTPNLFLINGRVAPDTYNWVKYLRYYFQETLSFFSLIMMKSRKDAERVISLGANPQNVRVMGDLKFSQTPLTSALKDIELPPNRKYIVAGSARKHEDRIILKAFREVKAAIPEAMLIIAPRHTARAVKIGRIAAKLNLTYSLRTKSQPGDTDDLYIIDTIGELCSLYAKADVAFVGGTLVQIGGHNPLEPAALGKPILMGPYYWTTKDSTDLLVKYGGAIIVKSSTELVKLLTQLLRDPSMAETMGLNAQNTVKKMQQIADRYIELIVKAAR